MKRKFLFSVVERYRNCLYVGIRHLLHRTTCVKGERKILNKKSRKRLNHLSCSYDGTLIMDTTKIHRNTYVTVVTETNLST